MIIPIVFSTDHNFVMPTCVTLYSLLKTAERATIFEINILSSPDVTESDREKIRGQVESLRGDCRVRFIEVGRAFEKGYETRGISTACYSRLLIPWLLPEHDKVIYSDVDIIFRGDITSAYEIDLGKDLVGGVTGEVWDKGLIKKYLVGLGLEPKNYINSGFLLINSKRQREEDLRKKYLELGANKYVYQDQDIINLACRGKIRLMPEEYNVKPSLAIRDEERVRVIHYIGIKPWQYFTYCWEEWWSCFKQSEVYDAKLYERVSREILGVKSRMRYLRKKVAQNLSFRFKLLGR